jgi:hypothetical protein
VVTRADPDGQPPAGPEPPEEPEGTVKVTGPGPLVFFGVLGLIGGWSLRPLSLRMDFLPPSVPLTSIAALFFVAAVVGATAYVTWRVVRRDRSSLAHHQAVNRLVLGKACALAGALVTGGYLGYALAQLGIDGPAADGRLWRSLVAALGGLAVCVAALLLELACRVPPEDD